MSDTFDHMCDAYERHWNGDGDSYSSRGGYSNYSNYNYDSLYYHKKYYFSSSRPVGDSYQIFYSDGTSFYVPKSLVKNKTESSCYIHNCFKPNRKIYSDKRIKCKPNENEERKEPTIPWEEAQYYL